MIVAVLIPIGLIGFSLGVRRRLLETREKETSKGGTPEPTPPPDKKRHKKEIGGATEMEYVSNIEILPEYVGSANHLHDEMDKSEPFFTREVAESFRFAREDMVWFLTYCSPEGSLAIQELLITAFTARNCLLGFNEHFTRDEFFISILLSEISDLLESSIRKAALSEAQLDIGLRSILFLAGICKEHTTSSTVKILA